MTKPENETESTSNVWFEKINTPSCWIGEKGSLLIAEHSMVTAKHKIADILQTHAYLREQLIDRYRCKFIRLKTALWLSEIAKSATVLDAAIILEADLDDLLQFLNSAIGLKEEHIEQR